MGPDERTKAAVRPEVGAFAGSDLLAGHRVTPALRCAALRAAWASPHARSSLIYQFWPSAIAGEACILDEARRTRRNAQGRLSATASECEDHARRFGWNMMQRHDT